MSDGDLDIKFYGDAAHILKEQAKLIKQQEQAIERYKTMGTESKKAGKDSEKAAKEAEKAQAASNRELDRFARATKEINRTPLEKYSDQMRQLNTALKAGKIDQETFNRATAGAKSEFESAGKARETAFGSMAMAKLVDFTASMGALTIATQVFTGAMERAQAVTRESMANVEGLVDSRRQLNQVGESSGDIQKLNDRADELAIKYGTPRAATRDMLFQARSLGFEGAADTIAEVAGANILDMGAASRAAGKVPGLFGNRIGPEAAMNATLVAAKESDLNFEQIANALPTAAEGAAPAGSGEAETIALLSVMAAKYKSGDTAAERIKSFGAAVATNDDFRGKGIVSAVKSLQGMPADQRQEFFGGNKELVLGYDAITSLLPTYQERLPKIQKAIDRAGMPDSFLETRIRESFDPATKEGRLNASRAEFNREGTALDVQREGQLAEGGFSRGSAVRRGTRLMEADPHSGMFQNFFGDKFMKYAESVHAPPRVIEAVGQAGKVIPIAMAENLLSRLLHAVDKLTGAAESQQRAGEVLQRGADANQTNYTNAARANQAAAGGAVEAR
jgi:hypothetical protein